MQSAHGIWGPRRALGDRRGHRRGRLQFKCDSLPGENRSMTEPVMLRPAAREIMNPRVYSSTRCVGCCSIGFSLGPASRSKP